MQTLGSSNSATVRGFDVCHLSLRSAMFLRRSTSMSGSVSRLRSSRLGSPGGRIMGGSFTFALSFGVGVVSPGFSSFDESVKMKVRLLSVVLVIIHTLLRQKQIFFLKLVFSSY